MKQELAPRSAARRLAAELKLPSWMGTVLCVTQPDGHILVVAAEERWRRNHKLPESYCGYPVIGEDPIDATASFHAS